MSTMQIQHHRPHPLMSFIKELTAPHHRGLAPKQSDGITSCCDSFQTSNTTPSFVCSGNSLSQHLTAKIELHRNQHWDSFPRWIYANLRGRNHQAVSQLSHGSRYLGKDKEETDWSKKWSIQGEKTLTAMRGGGRKQLICLIYWQKDSEKVVSGEHFQFLRTDWTRTLALTYFLITNMKWLNSAT